MSNLEQDRNVNKSPASPTERVVQERLKEEVQKVRAEALLQKLLNGGKPSESETHEISKHQGPIWNEISMRLRLLRAFMEGNSSFRSFLRENFDQEITPEIFKKITQMPAVKRGVAEYREMDTELPLFLLDPESPWFYVLKKSGVRTLGQLYQKLASNLDVLFVL